MNHLNRLPRSTANTMLIAAIGVAGLLTSACEGFGFEPSRTQECPLTFDQYKPQMKSFNISTPAYCPFNIGGVLNIPYGASGTFPSGAVFPNNFELSFSDRQGRVTAAYANTSWPVSPNGDYVLNISATYYAGVGGFDGNDKGFDIAHNRVKNAQGYWSDLQARLDYQFGTPSLNLTSGGSTHAAGVPVNFSANTNDPSFINPMTWNWYADGVLQQSGSDSQFEYAPPGPGHVVSVTGVDGNGSSHSAAVEVPVCSGFEFDC